MRLFDTHCHLDDPAFDADREACLRRMTEAGVSRALLMGTDLETSRRALACAGRFSALSAAAGVHPSRSGAWDEASGKALAGLLALPEAAAAGEFGLDFRPGQPPQELQLDVCERQLALAAEAGKPVCLHVVRAHQPMQELLRRWAPRLPGGVCHGFTGSYETARGYLDLGMMIAIGGAVTWKDARRVPDTVRKLPPDRLLLETDSPWQAPEGHRGERNEPCFLPLIAAQIAEIRHTTVWELAEQTRWNAEGLFGPEG